MRFSSAKPLHIDSSVVKHKQSFSSNGGYLTYTKHSHREKNPKKLRHINDKKKGSKTHR